MRPGLSAARNAAVASEIAPHWGAALPVVGIMIEADNLNYDYDYDYDYDNDNDNDNDCV